MLLASMLTRGAIATPTDQLGATQAKDVPRIGLRVAAQIHETKRSRVPCTGAGHRLKQRQKQSTLPSAAKGNLNVLEQRLLKFQRRYNDTAAPFDWRFSRSALHELLDRISRHEQIAA